MGNVCTNLNADEETAAKQNRVIEDQIKADKGKLRNEIKLLLLGAGESGKSTIVKQMKIIHDEGFNQEERDSFKEVVNGNIINAMQSILLAVTEHLPAQDIKITLPADVQKAADFVVASGEPIEITKLEPEMVTAIKTLWSSEAIQEAYSHSSKFQLIDSAKYYFDEIDRICDPGYQPNDQDVLRCRVKTTGIVEMQFYYKNLHFRMSDVGGQRSERKKWIHCFENVTAIIFCVALSAYDLTLIEDETHNRMQEALRLFDSICNNSWFKETSMILFLNKKDLFADKIAKVPLSVCFPEYSGANEEMEARQYIQQQFTDLNNAPDQKSIYCQYTVATDTENVKFVFAAVTDTI
eukprot:Awhi_evm1s14336